MIEELTPQILMMSMVLIIVLAPILTFSLSSLLLWRYRRAVTLAMEARGGFTNGPPRVPTGASPPGGSHWEHAGAVSLPGGVLYRQLLRGSRHSAMGYGIAWLGSAFVFAAAAHFVYPSGLGLPGFLIAVWIYFWPVVPALALILPGSMLPRIVSVVVYFAVFAALGFWAATIANIPAVKLGAVDLPARSSVAPMGMVTLWLSVNGATTLLVLLCFNRWVRAVAPLVLALVTPAVAGTWFAWVALYSPKGVDAAVLLSVSLDIHIYWVLAATGVVSLVGFTVLGWALARWTAYAYRRRRVSDQSLMLDSLWLIFASTYCMWLVIGGFVWMAAAPAAFTGYKLALAGARVVRRKPGPPVGLTFLRVFSTGRPSEALLHSVTGLWRHIGSVHMIAGPDVARSTVHPHQFLDFISGKLNRHFVEDQASLERSMAERDLTADPDGRFRINSLFCRADSWQPALPQLVQEGDIVLMDLRNFTAEKAGCIHELNYLARAVPFSRCRLVVDKSTDMAFLGRTLERAWDQLPPDSPNYGHPPDPSVLFPFDSGKKPLQMLVRGLCDAAKGG